MINGFSFRWHMAPTISGCLITLYYALFVYLRSCYCYRPINPRVNIIPYKKKTEISPLVTLISTTGSRKHNLFINVYRKIRICTSRIPMPKCLHRNIESSFTQLYSGFVFPYQISGSPIGRQFSFRWGVYMSSDSKIMDEVSCSFWCILFLWISSLIERNTQL